MTLLALMIKFVSRCWVGEWKVDILINLTDDDGWVYAFSFNDQVLQNRFFFL